MIVTLVLGFIFWGIMTWVKRRYLKSAASGSGSWDDLPKELRDPPPDSKKPRRTYAEAKKEYMEKHGKNKPVLDMFEEAKIRKEVMEKHGHYRTVPNEGAFAIYERRKQEREARLKIKKEVEKRMEAAAREQESAENGNADAATPGGAGEPAGKEQAKAK